MITYDLCIGQRRRAHNGAKKRPWHLYFVEYKDGIPERSFALHLFGMPIFGDTPDDFPTKKEAIAAARVVASIVRSYNTHCGILIEHGEGMLEVPNG